MKVTFQRETCESFFEEALPLLQDHYEEIAWNKDKIPLAVDVEAYRKMEAAGILVPFSLRTHDEEMIAYAVYFVRTNPHYARTLFAMNDVVYMKPEYRGGVGSRFLEKCERELKELGVQVITYHIKDAYDWSPAILRQGFEKMETLYQKWIGD